MDTTWKDAPWGKMNLAAKTHVCNESIELADRARANPETPVGELRAQLADRDEARAKAARTRTPRVPTSVARAQRAAPSSRKPYSSRRSRMSELRMMARVRHNAATDRRHVKPHQALRVGSRVEWLPGGSTDLATVREIADENGTMTQDGLIPDSNVRDTDQVGGQGRGVHEGPLYYLEYDDGECFWEVGRNIAPTGLRESPPQSARMEQPEARAHAKRAMHRSAPIRLFASAGAGDRSFNVIASSEDLNTQGFRILQSGWDLRRFTSGGPLLLEHRAAEGMGITSHDAATSLPIGRVTNVRVEGGVLRATITIATVSAHPLGDLVLSAIRERTLGGISVGCNPLEMDEDTITRAELLELSVCAIPSDAKARIELSGRR